MELTIFMITIGMLIAFGLIGIGVCIGDAMAKGKYDGNNGVQLRGDRVPDDGSSVDRHNPPDSEEIINVLWVLRLGASAREKRVIDYLLTQEGEQL